MVAFAMCIAIWIFTLLSACLSVEAVTLSGYTQGKPVRLYIVGEDKDIPLADDDATNNIVNGDRVLHLARKGLTDLTGIASLRVLDKGREKSIRDVDNLVVYLNGNSIHELPAEFYTLQKVTFLYLDHNKLDAIPPQIATMKGLLGMYYTANRIRLIPPEVFTMTTLRKLQVSKNYLTEVPAALGNLTQLRHLNLSDNQIEVLPDTMGRLTLLRVCDFSGNKIKELPESFSHVPVVHQLRVCNNPLTSLPIGFAEMPGNIDVTGTKIDVASLPPELRAKISREKVVADPDKKFRPKPPRKRK